MKNEVLINQQFENSYFIFEIQVGVILIKVEDLAEIYGNSFDLHYCINQGFEIHFMKKTDSNFATNLYYLSKIYYKHQLKTIDLIRLMDFTFARSLSDFKLGYLSIKYYINSYFQQLFDQYQDLHPYHSFHLFCKDEFDEVSYCSFFAQIY